MRRWGRLGRWALVGATTALAGGCGLLVGFPDRTLAPDESSGGASASSGGMGGDSSSASSGGGGHGGAPTTVTSTGSASSSSPSSTSTGGPLTYCDGIVPAPLFCEDFDKNNPLQSWDVTSATNGKVAVSAAPMKVQPDNALEVRLDGGGEVSANHGRIERVVPGSYASMHLAFDVYVDHFASLPDTTYVAAIYVGTLGTLMYIVAGDTKIQQKSGTSFDNDLASGKGLTEKQWSHIDLELTLVAGGTSRVTLKVDSNAVLNDVALTYMWTPGEPTVTLGLPIINDTGARAVYYDNVVFTSP